MALREGEMITPPGIVLIRQGEVSRDIFFWTGGGRLRISVDGKPIRELDYNPAEKRFLGDLAALLGRPRSSTVECLTPNKFIRITFEEGKIERLVKGSPEVARQWLESLARIAYDALVSLSTRDREIGQVEAEIAKRKAETDALGRRWAGLLYFVRRSADHFSVPGFDGLARYFSDLKLFGQQLGDPDAVEEDLIDVQIRKLILGK
jgi:CRP-like cAMP-binding protein